ncbi:HK97 family phage prohead protease [Angustibacter luteus]|uniref:HK97 family phage prohead protease n=1 Tax=Angustibacter luteus TaxID=658456 RepID=A0ABW1JIE6_9ACTN
MSALDRILEAAAEARADGIRQSSDRPRERRAGEQPGPALVRVRADRMELRESTTEDGALHFTGYASVYDRGYEMWDFFGPYTEQVTSGAGARSLANPELDVPLVLAHDSLRRIARTTNGTLTLSEDEQGLLADAPSLDAGDADVAYIAPKLRSGLVDEMSFRFVITDGSWSSDWTEYHIEGYDIHRGDVAIVGYGANPYTAGSGLRGQQLPKLEELTESDLRDLERRLDLERSRRGGITRSAGMTFAELCDIDRGTVLPPALV